MESGRTQDRGSAATDAERAMAGAFVSCRLGQLAFSSLMVAGDRRQFRRPGVQAALLGGTVLESAWLARRILGAGRYEDRVGVWVDAAFSAAGLMVCEAALGDGGAAPWMKNIAIGAALGAASTTERVDGAAAMAVLATAGVLAGLGARGRDAHVAGTALAVNDVINWTGMYIAARIYVESHRRYARLRDEADDLALARASEAASQDERARQHRLLHEGTVQALQALARSDDPVVAGRLASHEAARLRHALRTRGDAPTGLDASLCDIVEAVAERGLRVELVTVELTATLHPAAVEAVSAAVLTSLLAGREFGAAERAVLRATSEDGTVTVTIRDRGCGFAPNGRSDYETRLSGLARTLATVDGHAHIWSAPGRGVRVTLDVPAVSPGPPPVASGAERRVDHPPHGLPFDGRGDGPAGHDDRCTDDGDVDRGSVRSLVGTAKHEARPPRVGHVDVGAGGEPAQAGLEQGEPGQDARRRGVVHGSTMTSAAAPVVGRSTPFGDAASSEAARAERTILAAVLAWRFTGVATGAAALVAGHRRYRSRLSGVTQLGVAACESAWLARRVWRASRWRRSDAGVDALTAILMLAWGRFNLEPADRRTWLNWAPWSFAANAVTVQAIGVESLASAVTGGTAIAGANATVNPRLADVVASTGAMAAFFAGSRLFARQIRGGAARLEAAQAEAVRAGVELAAERERAVQLRVLHDGALQTLEAVGSGRHPDMAAIRAEAEAEASKLQREMDGLSPLGESFIEGIDAVIRDHIRFGLDVELHLDPVGGPSARVARALRDACNEALVNVRKHAGTDRATVEVRRSGTGLEVVVADRGRGFDPTKVPAGFGRTESMAARLAAVGGRADVVSVPGEGTTVTLWGPR